MKKVKYTHLLLGVISFLAVMAGVLYSCQKDDMTAPVDYSLQKKGKPHVSTAVAPSVYFSPDSASPYSCYVPCNVIPMPTGIDNVSNSGTVIQVSMVNLGYLTGYTDNYADSIQYVVSDGTHAMCWTEKWCNTNGAYMPISTLQPLLISAGITSTTGLTITGIPYGAGGTAGASYTTNPFSL